VVFLEAVTLGAKQGTKDHDRWLLADSLLERKPAGRRNYSKLPALIDLVLTRPLVSAGMIAAELGVTATAPGVLIFTQGGKRRARPASRDRARPPFRLSAEHAGCALPSSIALIWSATDSMERLFSV